LVMREWLNHFSYQTPINWMTFIVAALIAMGLALLITTIQALIASRADPVTTLKYE